MDKRLKTKWVKALRGGRYKQGVGRLLDGHGHYCAIGVLCRVAGESRAELRDGNDSLAPLSCQQSMTIINLNDTRGYSFKEIADYIEREL